jgi:hypothetical protein
MPGTLVSKGLAEVEVALVAGDGDGPFDEPEPAPDGLVSAADAGPVVSVEEDRPGRLHVERLSKELADRDGVAAGEGLDLDFIEERALLDLGRDDEPPADERGARRLVPPVAGDDKQVSAGLRCVGAEHGGDRLDEGGLAVGAGPHVDEQDVLADDAGERVADDTGQVGAHLGIRLDLLEELGEARRGRVRVVDDRGLERAEVDGVVVADRPGAEVDGAVRDVEEPRVRVERARLDTQLRVVSTPDRACRHRPLQGVHGDAEHGVPRARRLDRADVQGGPESHQRDCRGGLAAGFALTIRLALGPGPCARRLTRD